MVNLNNFKEFDFEGEKTLESISVANKFNRWMYDAISPYCNGKILEIGSGIGNISNFFLKNGYDITLSDIRSQYRDFLTQVIVADRVLNIDIVHPNFENEYKDLLGKFDTVFALNVVEHVKDDVVALRNIQKLSSKDGTVVILVPAYQSLYNEFDKQLYHFRRYTKNTLRNIIPLNTTIIKEKYFNFMGILGWFIVGGILKKEIIPKGDMKIYDFFVPFFKIVDKLLFNRIGLSCIIIFKNNKI